MDGGLATARAGAVCTVAAAWGLLKRVWVVCERRRVEGCVASHTSTGAATEAAVLEGTKERQEFKRQGARHRRGEEREESRLTKLKESQVDGYLDTVNSAPAG